MPQTVYMFQRWVSKGGNSREKQKAHTHCSVAGVPSSYLKLHARRELQYLRSYWSTNSSEGLTRSSERSRVACNRRMDLYLPLICQGAAEDLKIVSRRTSTPSRQYANAVSKAHSGEGSRLRTGTKSVLPSWLVLLRRHKRRSSRSLLHGHRLWHRRRCIHRPRLT